jgi:hypothetical protein
MGDYNPDKRSFSTVKAKTNNRLKDLEVYRTKLRSYLNEVSLKPFDDDIRNISLAFVPLLCNIYVEKYKVENKKVVDVKFNSSILEYVTDNNCGKDNVIIDIERQILQGKDYKYPQPEKRPLIFDLPFTDGEKDIEWNIPIHYVPQIINKFVLHGKPGSGKTISARYIALDLIKNDKLPVYIELQDYFENNDNVSQEGVCNYVEEKYKIQDFAELLNYYIDNDLEIVYIFDGIDEIYNESVGSKILNERLNSFVQDAKRAILTCRTGYSEIKKYTSLPILRIKGLQTGHIDELCVKYSNVDPVEFKDYIKNVPSALKNRPIFIVLLIALFEKKKNFP